MLALAWDWQGDGGQRLTGISRRLASSLCAGIGGRAVHAELSNIHFAYRPIGSGPVPRWGPAVLDDDRIVAFHGYFDNAAEIASALAAPAADTARLYGLAVARWGDEADRRLMGEYCSVIADPRRHELRLARSPLRAPPLHYAHQDEVVVAASVPRALFAAGIHQKLNEIRVADSAMLNFSDEEASWFEGVRRVPVGHVVELSPGTSRRLRRYYDVTACPPVPPAADADHVERAIELLDEGIKASLTGAERPGATLSGGLDSPLVAARTIAALPADRTLPTFTFHPEPGWDGITTRGGYGDEREFVRAFAAMHPRLEPHFTANQGYGHDHNWRQLFHLMGGAPVGLPNMYVYHGLFEMARDRGCDLLIQSEWGNRTFSNRGSWGFSEYLVTGQWKQLGLALERNPHDDRSMARKFLALSVAPLLPRWLYWALSRVLKPEKGGFVERITPLRADYRRRSGAEARARSWARDLNAWQLRSRRHALELEVQRADWESGEIMQAFEQLYGIRQRDPTAYRPFAEFCFGLPTRMFLRDGEARWLAREMNRGVMPEKQRRSVLNGRWDADWHLRIKRHRGEFLAELERIEADPRLAAMLDVDRIRAALEDYPAETSTGDAMYTLQSALPRLLMTARFIDWAEGRNR